MATDDLFTAANGPAPAKAPGSGLLVTNHLNLMYMLAAGLVMPPAGFGGKYYRDTLECFPGWIPLFIGKVPREAIESCTREADHLKPVIVEIGLSELSGDVIAIGEDGPGERRFPDQLDGTERLLLVPAPLPVSRIESIVFPSAKEKQACEADAGDFGNVPLKEFKLRTHRSLFTKAPDTPWPPGEGPPERCVPLQAPLAAGGVMAMLLRFANLGEQAVRACRAAFDPDDGDATRPADDHPILAGLEAWIRDGAASLPAPADPGTDRVGLQNASQARLFWEAVERLVEWRDTGRVGRTGGAGSAEEVLIDHLAAAVDGLDPRLKIGVGKLRDTLVSLTGLADATAGELFERHDTPLAHAMTLFLLRHDCVDLFDYDSDRLAEPDWLAAAVLFGVRDGWMNLPLRLRAGRALSDAVSHRMARMSHRIAGTGLDLGRTPARVRPLRELFGDGSNWRSRERSAALALARARKWDCVHTRISLGPGEYKLTVKGGATYIDLPGEPRVSPEIDRDRFLALLAGTRLDHDAEAKVRAALGAGAGD